MELSKGLSVCERSLNIPDMKQASEHAIFSVLGETLNHVFATSQSDCDTLSINVEDILNVF
jgi:hypothetical protein